jgi:glycosyltransferase involved in cell wall biosynthesis
MGRAATVILGGVTSLRIGMLVVSQYESDPRVRRQAEALAARGDDVTVLALHSEDRPREEMIEGVRVIHLPVRKYRGDSAKAYLALYGSFAARAAAWLARRPRAFDLVQAHSMPEALVFAAIGPRLARLPVLLDVHDLTSQLFASKFAGRAALMALVRGSEQAALRFATEVITVHEAYADLLRRWTRRPVHVVMNCPDGRLFGRPRWRSWDPAGEVVFSYHGLIAPRHGLDNAVRALDAVRRELPGARLQVRGSGDGLGALRDLVGELGLGDAVDLPQRLLTLPEVVSEIDRVHIGLVPSVRDAWTEWVLPTKLLEYAALGIPVVTFRNPVIERYFPEDTVSYVDPASPENLRAAMLDLARNPEKARAQAARAQAVMSELSWDVQRQVYFDIVDNAVARRRG